MSIVDVYSIIKPRLLFEQNLEVVCTNHYLCRRDKTDLFFTPGGNAVLQSLFKAIQVGINGNRNSAT